MNYTPLDASGNPIQPILTPAQKPSRKFLKKPVMLVLFFLLSSLVVILGYIGQQQILKKRAEPDVIRWCRDNSFKGTIEAPSQVTAQSDGTFSFTARLPFDADEACVSIAERLDENVVDGLPGATRATTCVSPLLSNNSCNVSVSWDGRFGADPETMRISGRLTGSECRLYLLSIRGIPSCARGNVTVRRAATQPTPTIPIPTIPIITVTTAPTPTRVATPTPTKTPTPTPTKTPTPTPTKTPTPFPSGQPTPTPTKTPTPTQTPTPTPLLIVSATNTPGPSATNVPPTTVVQQPTTTPSLPQAGSIIPAAVAFTLATLIILFGLVL